MSDLESNLTVVTGHLTELGNFQETAANKITGANRETADIAAKIRETHGLICYATSQAMAETETARRDAGDTMSTVSTEFKQKLDTAAVNYDNVDYREGRSIGEVFNV
ncbi:ESX-1 secretion-associated protein [Mycolicibacterium sp.]|uniref:ESX-1 secretion-associated protein n=1 Tax=Mycolicibacterium sp. TaxID=2320850 RepID=UPI001A206FE8|nr:ESX-1 secretion-associated protein [Mycolicibacterium sp.]MBJ7341428.1 ESX-1 secretion-associated protein [Mycolicibacterium sp.]